MFPLSRCFVCRVNRSGPDSISGSKHKNSRLQCKLQAFSREWEAYVQGVAQKGVDDVVAQHG